MKIENSTVNLASQHSGSRQVSVEESLRAWVGQQHPDFEGAKLNPPVPESTTTTISAAGNQSASNAQACAETSAASSPATDPKIIFLIALIEVLTGHKASLFNPDDLKMLDSTQTPSTAAAPSSETSTSTASGRHGWGIEYDKHEVVYEAEQTSFSAHGVVNTADGKQIQFNVALSMQREFHQETNLSIRRGDGVKKDPLVINFNGSAAQLTDTKFSFDLASNGKPEKMPFVTSGSGFLALDKNSNGGIDNGGELFGAQSGNGFSDLAAYDTDGNNWIDENDPVYSKLLVWSKDGDGADTLHTLAQHNVGALYLGNVASSFDLKNEANDLRGQIRSTGIYLNENGSAGTLQQVDLVV